MTTTLRLPRTALVTGAGLLAAGVLVLMLTGGAEADDPPIRAVSLTTEGHNEFTDDVGVQVREKPAGRSTEVVNLRDASNVAVGEFTIQPGVWFPWHTHPGTGLVAVAQGDLVFIYADDCVERPYDEGDAFVDPGIVHTAYNPGDTETVVIATFLGVPEDAPLATPVDSDTAEALNDDCGTEAPVPDPDPDAAAHDH
jgi:quercetin dioxygenase-like cupin family protein